MRPSVPKPQKDQADDLDIPPPQSVSGVAKRADMFRMFDRHAKRPDRFDGDQSAHYAGEWFEIDETSYSYMLDILPPLWMRGPIFAMREFMTGSVTSVFYAIRSMTPSAISTLTATLSDPNSVEAMRSAILDRETPPVRAMSRQERLEHIWSTTADDYRGYAGPRWPKPMQAIARSCFMAEGRAAS